MAASQPSRGHRGPRQASGEEDISDPPSLDDISNSVSNNRASDKPAKSNDKPWIKKQHPTRKQRKVTKPRPVVKKLREKYFLRSKTKSPKVEPGSSEPNKGSKHFFKTKKHGIPVRTTDRWFKCIACPAKRGTQREINNHYRSTHQPLRCPVCRDLFFTPATLQHHSYYQIHPLQFSCGYNNCDKVFPFTSDRDHHSMVHRTVKTHQCMSKGCGK